MHLVLFIYFLLFHLFFLFNLIYFFFFFVFLFFIYWYYIIFCIYIHKQLYAYVICHCCYFVYIYIYSSFYLSLWNYLYFHPNIYILLYRYNIFTSLLQASSRSRTSNLWNSMLWITAPQSLYGGVVTLSHRCSMSCGQQGVEMEMHHDLPLIHYHYKFNHEYFLFALN